MCLGFMQMLSATTVVSQVTTRMGASSQKLVSSVKEDHEVFDCPHKSLPYHMAKYIGSARTGAGFHHTELAPVSEFRNAAVKNVGVVYMKVGDLSKDELVKEFEVTYKTN